MRREKKRKGHFDAKESFLPCIDGNYDNMQRVGRHACGIGSVRYDDK